MFIPVLVAAWSEPITPTQIVAVLTVVLLPSVVVVGVAARRRSDRTLAYYAGYLLALLAAVWVQRLAGTDAVGGTPVARWRSVLADVIQLPYAWCYLGFVAHYFALDQASPRWAAWARVLRRGYLVAALLVGLKAAFGLGWSSWTILVLHLVNLLGSYMLSLWAWWRRREGAGWFLIAVLPLALSGLLHAVQWVVARGGSTIDGVLPFWAGVVLQTGLFLTALVMRQRRRSAQANADASATEAGAAWSPARGGGDV